MAKDHEVAIFFVHFGRAAQVVEQRTRGEYPLPQRPARYRLVRHQPPTNFTHDRVELSARDAVR